VFMFGPFHVGTIRNLPVCGQTGQVGLFLVDRIHSGGEI
jgi:hypothetical protein